MFVVTIALAPHLMQPLTRGARNQYRSIKYSYVATRLLHLLGQCYTLIFVHLRQFLHRFELRALRLLPILHQVLEQNSTMPSNHVKRNLLLIKQSY